MVQSRSADDVGRSVEYVLSGNGVIHELARSGNNQGAEFSIATYKSRLDLVSKVDKPHAIFVSAERDVTVQEYLDLYQLTREIADGSGVAVFCEIWAGRR